ncbi:MAG: hypothetical protein ACXVXC_05805 [Nocardioidaceae bacterium]
MSTYETVRARPISLADVAALARKDAEPVEVFKAKVSRQHGLSLTPVTLTPKPVGSRERAGEDFPHTVIFLTVPDPGPAMHPYTVDRNQPVGHEVEFTVVSMFEARSKVTLYTSEEAERTASLMRRSSDPERGRRVIYVPDERAEEMRLTPVYGSQLNVGVVVKDLSPEEVAVRAEAALRAEFGDALGSVAKMTARPAEDVRVNVYTSSDKEELLAANVLAAEAGYVAPGKPYVEEVDPSAQPVDV